MRGQPFMINHCAPHRNADYGVRPTTTVGPCISRAAALWLTLWRSVRRGFRSAEPPINAGRRGAMAFMILPEARVAYLASAENWEYLRQPVGNSPRMSCCSSGRFGKGLCAGENYRSILSRRHLARSPAKMRVPSPEYRRRLCRRPASPSSVVLLPRSGEPCAERVLRA